MTVIKGASFFLVILVEEFCRAVEANNSGDKDQTQIMGKKKRKAEEGAEFGRPVISLDVCGH
jgi:hypothetical protein